MTPALEARRQERVDDRQGEGLAEDPTTESKHIGVVVLARKAGHELTLTQRRPHAMDFVRGDVLALPAASEHDAEVRFTSHHGAAHSRAERGIVDGLFGVSTEVGDVVPGLHQVIRDR
jgi:hypothetical protein